jgi:hypothetical protein
MKKAPAETGALSFVGFALELCLFLARRGAPGRFRSETGHATICAAVLNVTKAAGANTANAATKQKNLVISLSRLASNRPSIR